MKKCLLTILVGTALWLVSDLSPAQAETLEEKKAYRLKEIDERLANLNELRSCVSVASDESGLHACREKAEEFHDAKKLQRMERRKGILEKRIEHQKDKVKSEGGSVGQ